MHTLPLQAALDWLGDHDAVIAELIATQPPVTVVTHTDYYGALASSIIGQQLSVKAAASIKRRFIELFGTGAMPQPAAIMERSHDELRSIGLSNAKARYIRDLAEHVLDGRIRFDRIDSQSNTEIIAELTNVKGIGEWTVHMFLMFCVGRLNVLPTGDLGVRNAIRDRYGLPGSPTSKEVVDLAETHGWHPYETVACLYLWASYDSEPFVPI